MECGEWNNVENIMRNLWISFCGEVLKWNLVWVFVLWSVNNGVLKMEIWRSVCVNLRCGFFALNLKCVLNFFGFFAF